MKVLVIYDSTYGNTAKVARAIGEAFAGETKVSSVGEANAAELNTFNLLIVGSPTQGGRPTKAMQGFLHNIPESALKGIKAAAFDTRISMKLAGIFGFAAGRIADSLTKKGALVLSSAGFFVTGKESSLKEGELERAAAWARETLKNY
jgi:flavodoxin